MPKYFCLKFDYLFPFFGLKKKGRSMNIYNGHVFSLLFEPLCYYAKKVAIKIF